MPRPDNEDESNVQATVCDGVARGLNAASQLSCREVGCVDKPSRRTLVLSFVRNASACGHVISQETLPALQDIHALSERLLTQAL